MTMTRFVLAAAVAATALAVPAASAKPNSPDVCRWLYVYDPVREQAFYVKPCEHLPKP